MSKEPKVNTNVTESSSTAEVLEISKVVAETLRMLNDVYQEHLQSIAAIAIELEREAMCFQEDANSNAQANSLTAKGGATKKERFKEISEKAVNSVKSMAPIVQSAMDNRDQKDVDVSVSDYRATALQALSRACLGAVDSQSNANITALAAITEGIAVLYSRIGSSRIGPE